MPGEVAQAIDWVKVISACAALAALSLSIYNFFIGRRDRGIDRSRKVDDEFWLQKVVYPNSIEHLIKMWADIALVVGGANEEVETSREAAYHKASKAIGDAESKASLLAVVEGGLPAKVIEMIRSTEDYVAQWYSSDNAGGIKPSAKAIQQHCHEQQFRLIGCIKNEQKKM